MPDPRASTDEEHAPLLAGDEERRNGENSLFDPSTYTVREKILAAVGVLLLILAGTFIGLFAGAEHALKKERHHHKPTVTVTAAPPGPTGKHGKAMCTSSECVTLAADVLRSLDTSADPCEDFYQFANGGWLAAQTIPADRGLYGSFHAVADRNKKIILGILDGIKDKSLDESPEHANLRKLKDAYESCMDTDALNKHGIDPLMPHVKALINYMGKFDASEDAAEAQAWDGAYSEDYVLSEDLRAAAAQAEALRQTETPKADGELPTSPELESEDTDIDAGRRKKITAAIAYMHAHGVGSIIDPVIEGDAGGNNSQIQALFLYQSFGGLPAKEYYEEPAMLDLYQSVTAAVLTDIAKAGQKQKRSLANGNFIDLASEVIQEGWPWPWPGNDDDGDDKEPKEPSEPLDKRMDKLAGEVVKLEQKIARAGAPLEHLFNPKFSYNIYKTKDVQKALPFFDLEAYLASMAPRTFPTHIVVTHPPYLKSITKIVADTPDHVLSAYFINNLAREYSSALGPKTDLRKDVRRLEDVLKGVAPGTEEDRQNICLSAVDSLVGFIAGREFVREAFSPEAKADGEHIIKSIVSAFHDKLPHIKWMDAESAKAAQKKASAIIPKVGYPLSPNTTDPQSVYNYYARIKISRDDYFGNVLRTAQADRERSWGTLGRERNRNSWEMYPQTVNAYYSPPDGEIVFPAGILQPPFYSLPWPKHLKYGAFGSVAAHELTHAFDNSGAQYDEAGRLRDWWTNSTVKAFNERAQCIAKQYSKYYVLDAEGKKHYVNGNLTNGEDIGDSGLAQAYAAWKAEKEHAFALPGLDYTPEQLFFVAYARVWAQLTRPATAVARVRTDPHSPPYWRCTGTLRNMAPFHEAFKCKEGSGMRPKKSEQCELW